MEDYSYGQAYAAWQAELRESASRAAAAGGGRPRSAGASRDPGFGALDRAGGRSPAWRRKRPGIEC